MLFCDKFRYPTPNRPKQGQLPPFPAKSKEEQQFVKHIIFYDRVEVTDW